MRLRAASLFRFVLLGGVASVALSGASCSSPSAAGTGGAGGGSTLADVIYEGDANEALLAVLMGTDSVTDPPRYAWFDAPVEGAMLPSATAPTFSWYIHSVDGDAGAVPPPDGTAYLVVLGIPSNAQLLRVFTTNTTYTPDAAAWTKLKATKGETINAWILMGTFESGALAPDGGPFRGPWVTFSVSP
jgi:hypothetical protein